MASQEGSVGMLLYFRIRGASTTAVEVGPEATVGDLKKAVATLGGPAAEEQRLIFGGEEMGNDALPLADSGLSSEAAFEVDRLAGPPSVAACSTVSAVAQAGRVVGWTRSVHSETELMERVRDVAVGQCGGELFVAIAVSGGGVEVLSLGDEEPPLPLIPEVGGRTVVSVSAGFNFVIAVLDDGRAVAGYHGDDPPSGAGVEEAEGVVAASSCGMQTLLLTAAGDVVPIGTGPSMPDFGGRRALAVSQGVLHAAAVLEGGEVAAWGHDAPDPSDLDAPVHAVAAGSGFTLGVTKDGEVKGWGSNTCDQCLPPRSVKNVVRLAAGHSHAVAVLSSGQVVQWGNPREVPFCLS